MGWGLPSDSHDVEAMGHRVPPSFRMAFHRPGRLLGRVKVAKVTAVPRVKVIKLTRATAKVTTPKVIKVGRGPMGGDVHEILALDDAKGTKDRIETFC